MSTNRALAAHPDIHGWCPMGCGKTLFVGAGGHVTCSYIPCPRPTAVDELLADRETEHVVEFKRRTFTVRHPLHERLDDALMGCKLDEHIRQLDGPPVQLGRYRATRHNGRWAFTSVAAQAVADEVAVGYLLGRLGAPKPAGELEPEPATEALPSDPLLDEAFLNARIRFWTCPVNHPGPWRLSEVRQTVEWRGDVAHCLEPGCGKTSAEETTEENQ